MKEICCRFAAGGRLAGIITEPAGSAATRGCVLLNAGIVPKAGPFRLYTELGRRLARDGIATLRFDLGGVGDSPPDHAGLELRARTALEVRAAIDCLSERYPLGELFIGGLCSGAEDALRAAAGDPRATGAFLIDPFAYRSSDWFLRDLLHRCGRRLLRAAGVYRPLRSETAGADGARPKRVVRYAYMQREESQPLLQALVSRRAQVHFIYTAGARDTFNHPGQLEAQFPGVDLADRVSVDHLGSLDHTPMLAADRARLIETIAQRLTPSQPAHRPRQFSHSAPEQAIEL